MRHAAQKPFVPPTCFLARAIAREVLSAHKLCCVTVGAAVGRMASVPGEI